jgi:hypothetical protein
MFNFLKRKNKSSFKFKEPENTACFMCDHVLNRLRPILYVSHDSGDGTWQFMCGETDHTEANAKIISLREATEIDLTINDLHDMPLGVGAERATADSQWKPFRMA